VEYQHSNGFFKIKFPPYGEVTVLSNKKLVNELRNAPNEVLDFMDGSSRVSLFGFK
jgi:hypothetical protein